MARFVTQWSSAPEQVEAGMDPAPEKGTEMNITTTKSAEGATTVAWPPTGEVSEVEHFAHVQRLVKRIFDPNRREAIMVVTVKNGEDDPSIDPFEILLMTGGGIAVAVIPDDLTFDFTEEMPEGLSVFNGGVRTYFAGIERESDFLDAPLLIPERHENPLKILEHGFKNSAKRLEGAPVALPAKAGWRQKLRLVRSAVRDASR